MKSIPPDKYMTGEEKLWEKIAVENMVRGERRRKAFVCGVVGGTVVLIVWYLLKA